MKTTKRIISLILVFVMMTGLSVSMQAFADSLSDDWDYSVFAPEYNANEYRTSYFCSKIETTVNGDKTTETFTYDDAGRVVAHTTSYKIDNVTYTDTESYTYDSNGNVTKMINTSKAGLITTDYKKIVRSFDSKGRLKKETTTLDILGINKTVAEYVYTADGKLLSKTEWEYTSGIKTGLGTISNTYDKNGRLIKEKEAYSGKEYSSSYTYSYTYDKNGNILTEKDVISYDFDGDKNTENSSIKNTYDKNGRLTKLVSKTVSDDEEETETITYTYNKHGDVIKCTDKYTDEYGSYTEKTVNTYDSKYRLVKSVKTNDYGLISSEKYTYDKNGNITKYVFEDEESTETTKTTYNSNNKPVKVTYSCKSDCSGKYSYSETSSYDKHGNLTKTVNEVDGVKTTVKYSYKKLDKSIILIDNKIRMSAATYTYNGKAKKPVISIDGLTEGIDYTVSYKNNVKPGTAKAIITFTNKYRVSDDSGVVTISYKIKNK